MGGPNLLSLARLAMPADLCFADVTSLNVAPPLIPTDRNVDCCVNTVNEKLLRLQIWGTLVQ